MNPLIKAKIGAFGEVITEDTVLVRIVAMYQYRENYGAHAWDGTGECPQYWKFKGGDEVTLIDGLTVEQALCLIKWERISFLATEHEYSSEYATNDLIDINIELSGAPTREEIMNAWDMGIDLDEPEVFEIEKLERMPIDRYDAMAEELGYLNA